MNQELKDLLDHVQRTVNTYHNCDRYSDEDVMNELQTLQNIWNDYVRKNGPLIRNEELPNPYRGII